MDLQTFEQSIDEVVLERGLALCSAAKVELQKTQSEGELTAMVKGSRKYMVSMRIEGDRLIDHHCDCPFTGGPICKHRVAFLFFLQRERFKELIGPKLFKLLASQQAPEEEKSKRRPQRQASSSKIGEAQRIHEVLETVHAEPLREVLIQIAENDQWVAKLIRLRFAKVKPKGERRKFSKELTALIKAHRGYGSFIDGRSASALSERLGPYVRETTEALRSGALHMAFVQSTVLMDRLISALHNAHDSEGQLKGYLGEIRSIFQETVSRIEEPKLRREVSAYCLKTYKSGKFSGQDWHEDQVDALVALAQTTVEIKKVAAFINDAIASENQRSGAVGPKRTRWGLSPIRLKRAESRGGQRLNNRAAMRLQMSHLALLSKKGDEEAVESYITENIRNPLIRKMAIERAMRGGDDLMAHRLASDGVESDPTNGEVWVDYLYRLALKTGDDQGEIDALRWLLINGRSAPDSIRIQALKSRLSEVQWKEMYDEVIEDLRKGTSISRELAMELMIQEGDRERLTPLLERVNNLGELIELEPRLLPDMRDVLMLLYEKQALRLSDNMRDRAGYMRFCSALFHMRRMGGQERFEELVEQTREANRRRPSLCLAIEQLLDSDPEGPNPFWQWSY